MAGVSEDITYRLLGGGQPTLSCTRQAGTPGIVANPQSQDFHCGCLSFNGVQDSARLPVNQDIGIANAWTIMVWIAPRALQPPGEDETIFEIAAIEGSQNNAIRFDMNNIATSTIRLFSSGGVQFKRFDIPSGDDLGTPGVQGLFLRADEWVQLVFTWDGSDLLIYRNGRDVTSVFTKTTDIAGTMTSTDRSISIGSRVDLSQFYDGHGHSLAMWNVALDQFAVRTIWNQGCGASMNLQLGQDDYDAPDALAAWYRLGYIPSQPVRDYTSSGLNLAPFVLEESMPTGVILPFGGDTAPTGYLLCDGSAVDRSTFAALFAVIGEKYGPGDGSTTFNLPDGRSSVPVGKDIAVPDFDDLGKTGGEKEVQMEADQVPVHKHILRGSGGGDDTNPLTDRGPDSSDGGGVGTIIPAFSEGGGTRGVQENTGDDNATISPNDAHENMPPYFVANYIIQV